MKFRVGAIESAQHVLWVFPDLVPIGVPWGHGARKFGVSGTCNETGRPVVRAASVAVGQRQSHFGSGGGVRAMAKCQVGYDASLQQGVARRLIMLDEQVLQLGGPLRTVGQAVSELDVVAVQVESIVQPAVAALFLGR